MICLPFTVSAQKTTWTGPSVDFKHGNLRVSENRRALEHADGTPFFYLGDTAWELFHRLDLKDAEQYLEQRRAQGFTVIQAVILAEMDGLNTPNANGDKPLIDNDPAKPNEKYFAHVDAIIRLAADKGLYIGLLPTWGDKVDLAWSKCQGNIFDAANIELYGKFIGNRYKDFPNIIWINGGDRNGGGKNTEIWDALARGIRDVDKNHLMTFHPWGQHSSALWFHDRDWLDFNMCQTGHNDVARRYDIYQKLIADVYAKSPAKPVINGEPCYEDHPVNWKTDDWFDADDTRRAMYWSLFSGATGHTYGCHPVWQFFIPGREPVSHCRHTWQEVMDLPGAWEVIHARHLFASHPTAVSVPDRDLILTPQNDSAKQVLALRAENFALVYFPANIPTELNLGKFAAGKDLKLQWFNPRNGSSQAANRDKIMTPPAEGDWILIVEKI